MKLVLQKSTFIFAFILLLFSGCGGNKKIFEKYHKFSDLSWNRFDIVTFEVPVPEGGLDADFYLAIRHIPEIPYQSLKYNFTFIMPSGEIRTADYELAFVDKEGNMQSDCMVDLCDISAPVRKGLLVSDAGTLKIEIENKFTKVEMPGIMEVGLIVKESEEEL